MTGIELQQTETAQALVAIAALLAVTGVALTALSNWNFFWRAVLPYVLRFGHATVEYYRVDHNARIFSRTTIPGWSRWTNLHHIIEQVDEIK